MKDVVFSSKLYRVTAIEDPVTKVLPVYRTLTGYMRTRNAAPVEITDSVFETFTGLGVAAPGPSRPISRNSAETVDCLSRMDGHA